MKNILTIALGLLLGNVLIVLFAFTLSTIIVFVRLVIDKITELCKGE